MLQAWPEDSWPLAGLGGGFSDARETWPDLDLQKTVLALPPAKQEMTNFFKGGGRREEGRGPSGCLR